MTSSLAAGLRVHRRTVERHLEQSAPASIVDPLVDAAHLRDAFDAYAGYSALARQTFAYTVLSHPDAVANQIWVTTRGIMVEVVRGLRGHPQVVAGRTTALQLYQEFQFFLGSINARVLSSAQMAALRSTPEFISTVNAMTRVAALHHAADIRHAAYATALGIPYIGDNTFARFVVQTFLPSRHSAGTSSIVVSIRDFATVLGIP